MLVSILQLMGFPLGKPVHSRASENSAGKPTSSGNERINTGREKMDPKSIEPHGVAAATSGKTTRPAHAQAQKARSSDVKASSAKTPVSSKASAKKAVKAAPAPAAKPALKAKPAAPVPVKTAKAGKAPDVTRTMTSDGAIMKLSTPAEFQKLAELAGRPIWDKWVQDVTSKGYPGQKLLDVILTTAKKAGS